MPEMSGDCLGTVWKLSGDCMGDCMGDCQGTVWGLWERSEDLSEGRSEDFSEDCPIIFDKCIKTDKIN